MRAPTTNDIESLRKKTKSITLPDKRLLAYVEVGDLKGKPIFYFHGSPSSRLEGYWIDELGKEVGVRFIVPDRPGIGKSARIRFVHFGMGTSRGHKQCLSRYEQA